MKNTSTLEATYYDHVCPGQISLWADDYYNLFFFFICHAEYHLIDICIFISLHEYKDTGFYWLTKYSTAVSNTLCTFLKQQVLTFAGDKFLIFLGGRTGEDSSEFCLNFFPFYCQKLREDDVRPSWFQCSGSSSRLSLK